MDVSKSMVTQTFGCVVNAKEEGCFIDEMEDDRDQVTPQIAIDALSRYTVRPNGAYTRPNCSCSLCYCKYSVGDRIVCLPCQHNFHEYCIENWLKWVKSTCPIDRKSVVRRQYIQEVINERHNRMLEMCSASEINHDTSESESAGLTSENEANCSTQKFRRKNFKRQQKRDKDSEVNPPKGFSTQMLSPLGNKDRPTKYKGRDEVDEEGTGNFQKPAERRRNNPKNVHESLEINDRNGKDASLIASPNHKKLQDSVDAIRKSIKISDEANVKSDEFNVCRNVKKSKNAEIFQKELEAVTRKLSDITASPEKFADSYYRDIKSSDSKRKVSVSSSINKELEERVSLRGIMGRKSLTFGEMLEIENEVSSGWVYNNSNMRNFSGRIATAQTRKAVHKHL